MLPFGSLYTKGVSMQRLAVTNAFPRVYSNNHGGSLTFKFRAMTTTLRRKRPLPKKSTTFIRFSDVLPRPKYQNDHQDQKSALVREFYHINQGTTTSYNSSGDIETFVPHEDQLDDYLKKTSLSPWVPLPDSAARQIFDLVQARSDDKHVDLGCGDGRVCFYAVDYGRVQHSLGIDIDAAILERANKRKSKRHPAPTNLDFIQADLLDETDGSNNTWDRIADASIITMFLEDGGLKTIRPLLEHHLIGKTCRIVTCGYAMPGWVSTNETVVLGTTLYMYNWGIASVKRNENGNDDDDDDDDDVDFPIFDEMVMQKQRAEEVYFQGRRATDGMKNRSRFFSNEDDFDDNWDDDFDESDVDSNSENDETENENNGTNTTKDEK